MFKKMKLFGLHFVLNTSTFSAYFYLQLELEEIA